MANLENLERELDRYTFQDIIEKNPSVVTLLEQKDKSNASPQQMMAEAVLRRFLEGDTLSECEKMGTSLAILLVSGIDENFIQAFYDEYDEVPAEASASRAVQYANSYYSTEKLAALFPREHAAANRAKVEHERIIGQCEKAMESHDEEDIRNALSRLEDSLLRTREEEEIIRRLSDHLACIEKSNTLERSAAIEELRHWGDELRGKLTKCAEKVVSAAENPRDINQLMYCWCVTVADLIQEYCVLGGVKRQRFVNVRRFRDEYENADFSLPWYLATDETEQLEKLIADEILSGLAYLAAVEGVLNALDNMDDLSGPEEDLRPFSGDSIADRLLAICQAIPENNMKDWRNRLLNDTAGSEYRAVARELKRTVGDPLIAAKASEVELCGDAICSHEVVFSGKMLSVEHSNVFKDDLRLKGRESALPMGLRAKLEYSVEDYVPDTQKCTDDWAFEHDDANDYSYVADCLLEANDSYEDSMFEGYGYVGTDGKEYVVIYKVDRFREEVGWDSEFRCWDKARSWKEVEEAVATWVPAKWLVKERNAELGSVLLEPLESFLKSASSIEMWSTGSNPARQRLALGLGGHARREDFDPNADLFRSMWVESDERKSVRMIEVPIEFVVDGRKIFGFDQDEKWNEAQAGRKCRAEQQKDKRAEEERRRREANKEERYLAALDKIKPRKRISAGDCARIRAEADEAKKSFLKLGDHGRARELVSRIELDWKASAAVGMEVKLGEDRWVIYKIEMCEKGILAWLIAVDSVARMAFPASLKRGNNSIAKWANQSYFQKLYSFEQLQLQYWDNRQELDPSLRLRKSHANLNWDFCGDGIDHFMLPTAKDYRRMPACVKEKLSEGTSDLGWWLFDGWPLTTMRRALYVKPGFAGKGRVASTLSLCDEKEIRPICAIRLFTYPLPREEG